MSFDTPMEFNTPEDICSRAMQHLGARKVTSLANPTSRSETECASCYDKLRRAELQRNTWVYSTRKTALRPISANMTNVIGNSLYIPQSGPQTGSMLVTPATWSSSVTYTPGAVVTDPTIPGLLWTSNEQDNLNNAPGAGAGQYWDDYFGPIVATPFNPTTTYWAGELVYVQDPNTQGINVYRSLTNANGVGITESVTFTTPSAGITQITQTSTLSPNGAGNPWVLSEWNPLVTYNKDQIVQYQFSLWKAATELNFGNVPGTGAWWTYLGQVTQGSSQALMSGNTWLSIPCSKVQSIVMAYPVGAGPLQEQSTRNAYRLPAGFLRDAPQDPTAGRISYLGAPSGISYNDWVFEGKFLTTRECEPILFRFVANITKVVDMDAMFCEGLAARVAVETCETLTQSASKVQMCEGFYKQAMGEARIRNAIESGSDQPPEDDYILCRA